MTFGRRVNPLAVPGASKSRPLSSLSIPACATSFPPAERQQWQEFLAQRQLTAIDSAGRLVEELSHDAGRCALLCRPLQLRRIGVGRHDLERCRASGRVLGPDGGNLPVVIMSLTDIQGQSQSLPIGRCFRD